MKVRIFILLASLASCAAIAGAWFAATALALPFCGSGNSSPCVWRDPGYYGANSPNLVMLSTGYFQAYQPGPSPLKLQGWAYTGGGWHSPGIMTVYAGQTVALLYTSANVTVHAQDRSGIGQSNVTLAFP